MGRGVSPVFEAAQSSSCQSHSHPEEANVKVNSNICVLLRSLSIKWHVEQILTSITATFRRQISSLRLWLVFSSAQFTLLVRIRSAAFCTGTRGAGGWQWKSVLFGQRGLLRSSHYCFISLQKHRVELNAKVTVMHLKNCM